MENLPDWRLHDLAILTGTKVQKPVAEKVEEPIKKILPKKETAAHKPTKERAIKDEK